MRSAAITGSGVYTPEFSISNDELVASFNRYVDLFNDTHAEDIAAGKIEALQYSSSEFIEKASGIKSRYVVEKTGILDPNIMHPVLPERSDDEPSLSVEMALKASEIALKQAAKRAEDIDAVIVAASNMERAYPAMAIELQARLGIDGFAFDMNVACSSATFGIELANDMIRAGSVKTVLMVNPEICSAHLEWRDRDCHFIFGDVCTAIIIEECETAQNSGFEILSTSCKTQFSNNIRNNNGFLRRTRTGAMADRRDMLFMQEGRRVFKELLPMVSNHIGAHLDAEGVGGSDLKRIWLHQANKTMNDFAGKKIFGRTPTPEEQPSILEEYANTSSAGSMIAFSKHSNDLQSGDLGLISSFGAGYSVGSVLLKKL